MPLTLLVLLVLGCVFRIDDFLPMLGSWEHLQFFYHAGAVDPGISLRIAPRANMGGAGYPMLDIALVLDGWLPDTLTGFRLLIYVYTLGSLALMQMIFSRWFGPLPTSLGVVTAALSTGLFVFSNQFLMVIPTVFLSLLLVDVTQRLDRNTNSLVLRISMAFVLALLLIHYSMGRFFAVGWLTFYFAQKCYLARKAYGQSPAWRRYCWHHAGLMFLILLMTAFVLYLLDPRNLATLADPMKLFFPAKAEIVESSLDSLSSIGANVILILKMLLPFNSISGEPGPVVMLSGQRASILNSWHLPFLLVGFIVSVRRSFTPGETGLMPYLSLHVVLLMTIGLSIFSLTTETNSTISPYRIFTGFIALSGYMVVAFSWMAEMPFVQKAEVRLFAVVVVVAMWVSAGSSLATEGAAIKASASRFAQHDEVSGQFETTPQLPPYGIIPETYLQARFLQLAKILSDALSCRLEGSVLLVRVSPTLLAGSNGVGRTGYIGEFNEFSATLSLYLRSAGTPAGYVIVHAATDPGRLGFPNGYGGNPLKFSGPIQWNNGQIRYAIGGPVEAHLRPRTFSAQNGVVISFSETESKLLRHLAQKKGWAFRETDSINSLRSLISSPSNPPTICESMGPRAHEN